MLVAICSKPTTHNSESIYAKINQYTNSSMTRTKIAELKNKIGQEIKLQGWVDTIRDMGKISFIELRDTSGRVQCVTNEKISNITLESVIEVIGTVKERPENMVNKNEANGEIELEVTKLNLLNKAAPLPIPVQGDGIDIKEDSRLEYRYLDLRRQRLHNTLKLRSEFTKHLRDYFYENDFVEVETPILTASTMEGARDFVVPSRINPGKFYALPQSPQQYKQLLMTAGVERYFQFARCVRDENLRADRGFEFTQVDLEMSFTSEEDVMNFVENMVKYAVDKVGGILKDQEFPRFRYDEAISKYGADKFDIRTDEEKEKGVLAFAWVHKFPFFKKVDREDVAELRDGKSGWTFTHNPFSAPLAEHEEWHLKGENIDKIVTQQYDLVCNGFEVGGGSIRAHRSELLNATYRIMGYTDEYIEESIGHMLKAFELGTPPHGGIALGLDRLVALLANEKSIKEVIAFPMTYQGRTAVMKGPGEISQEQLDELCLKLTSKISSGAELQDRIVSFLNSQHLEFELISHDELPTTQSHIDAGNEKLDEARKSLILKGKKTGKNYLFVIPVLSKLNKTTVKEAIGEDFEFEKPEVILSKFGIEVGGVAPFGNLIGIQTYYDSSGNETEYSSFSTGLKTSTIRMKTSDFVRSLSAVEGEFGV